MNKSCAQIYLIPSTIAPDTQDRVITPYIHETISKLDYYLVENIRTARRYIASLGIRDVSAIHFKVFDKKTTNIELKDLLAPVLTGTSVGIISEAGCPAIADPGSKIVQWAHTNNIKVVPLVGPSSIILALMGSGMNGQNFEFHGYLPIDKIKREKAIKYLEHESSRTGKCQIFMETPYRNTAMANDLIRYCRDQTAICFACNLTSSKEFVMTKTVKHWRDALPDLQKKPTIFLMQARY